MKLMFLSMIAAYLGGNVYIFIRTLQTLSSFSVGGKLVFSAVYWLVAFALVISMFARNVEMPEFLVNNIVTPDDDPNFRRMKQQKEKDGE